MLTSQNPTYDKEHLLANLDTFDANKLAHQAIINFAKDDLSFALKIFNPKSLTLLNMQEDDLIALFLACSAHKDRSIYRYLLLFPSMLEFAKKHNLDNQFEAKKSKRSKPRSLTPPANFLFFPLKFKPTSTSAPNSPKITSKRIETALYLLRTTILSLFKIHVGLPFNKEGDGMSLINQLYLESDRVDDLEPVYERLQALLNKFFFPNIEVSCERLREYIDLELITSATNDKWSHKISDVHTSLVEIIKKIDPSLPCTKNHDFIKNLEELTKALTNYLYIFSAKSCSAEIYESKYNLLLINFYCALINLISIHPTKLNPHTLTPHSTMSVNQRL